MPKDDEGQHYIDPKKPDPKYYVPVELQFEEGSGSFFMLPAFSYGLGVAVERLDIPSNITVLCLGKSTYARAGVICNVTPGEPGWRGHLTLEFMNAGPLPCRFYVPEGIIRLAFIESDEPEEAYNRKYQDQPEMVVLGKMELGI
jgi:dCTP deaminase